MPACAPQRFLANNRNAIRDAILTPSSVLPIDNGVLYVPTGRSGTAQVLLTGAFTGAEQATYDVEIVNDTISVPLISAPILTGEGSGTLSAIASTGAAEDITVELAQSGVPLLSAAVDFEGVIVKARAAGAVGNTVFINVDQSALVFTPQQFSLLHDLDAGAGGKDAPMKGSEFDFDTAILGADNQIPPTSTAIAPDALNQAHRISFGADRSAIYLQYKQYKDGEWSYYLVPALKRAVPRGAIVNFVTGGRTVRIATGSPAENVYTGIVTLYDLLNAIKSDTGSPLADVDDVVANDRSPTGQASQELQTRTDAHVEPSSGTGSTAATGFVDTSCEVNAGTQLVSAVCRAVTAKDHPLASVGRERWELRSSLAGAIATIVTGEPFSNADFGLTIPVNLPFNFGVQKGAFSVTSVVYMARPAGAEDPTTAAALCPVALTLGPAAVDQTIQLVYTARPSGNCLCDGLPIPNLDTSCLGNSGLTGDDAMGYQTDTIERLKLLRTWYRGIVRTNSYVDSTSGIATQDAFLTSSAAATNSSTAMSLKDIVDRFERTLALLDPLTTGSPTPRGDGCLAWDDAFDELKADVAVFDTGSTDITQSIPADRYIAALDFVLTCAGLSPLGEFDASSTVSGDGCWRDYGDAFYWTVVGANGAYAPAFTNKPYYSSRRASAKGAYYSTQEFAFQINCKCPQNLLAGDIINLAIGDSGWPATYQLGDELILPIIAAHDLYLAGGQDASLVETWYVTSSARGPLPAMLFDPDAPTSYADGSPAILSFLLNPGGIPFAKGDKFAFSVEGGHYRTRKDGGSWTASTAIPAGSVVFQDGLSIEFRTGASPSFVALDRFSFTALQPWAVSNLTTPTVERWQWTGASPTLDIDLGSVQTLDMAAIALHTLPAGATITLAGGVASAGDWTDTLTWREGVIAKALDAVRSARYLRLTLGSATGGGVGWLWVGQALTQSLSANSLPRLTYRMNRGSGGLNTRGRFLGKGIGGDVEWTEAALSEADLSGIVDMVDSVKENDDEPIIFLPQVTRPVDAFLVQIMADEVDMPDLFDWQPDASKGRRHSVKLPLQAVLQ